MNRKQQLLETYRLGDHLTNDRLRQLRDDMYTIDNIAREYGDTFTIMSSYARRIYYDCQKYLDARLEQQKGKR